MAKTANLPVHEPRSARISRALIEPEVKRSVRVRAKARRNRRLTLEEEVSQAQRIELAVEKLLELVLQSPVGARELVSASKRTGHGGLHSRQSLPVAAEAPDAPEAVDGEPVERRDEVLDAAMAELGALADELEALLGERMNHALGVASRKRELSASIERVRGRMFAVLADLRIEKRHLEPIVRKLEQLDETTDRLFVESGARGQPRGRQTGSVRDPNDGSFELPMELQLDSIRQIRRIEERTGLRALELKRLVHAAHDAERELNDAMGEMVEWNVPLVLSLAKKAENRGVPFEDLVQEGTIGLIHAVERYEWRHGLRFSTYATWWIRQAIAQAVSDLSRNVRLPINVSRQIVQLNYAKSALSRALGHEADVRALAERMKLPEDRVEQLVPLAWREVSLDAPVSEGADTSHVEMIVDEQSTLPAEVLDAETLRATTEEMLGTLTSREELVLRLRYGLAEGEGQTLEEIGQVLGVTRERVRQIEAKALERLRHPKRAKILREFLD
ncbi:sigma-70 family RNA polymerase sigma factor [Myxococcota bacterium]|nr:sigma-70 family RNA polymerase sigma factor [Myxococcota bacterium]